MLRTVFIISVVCLALSKAGRSSEDGGFGCSCLVVDSTVTNCTGASGKSCSDSANLMALVHSNTTTAKVCSSPLSSPVAQTINFRLQGEVGCRSCICFTAPLTETRNCSALNSDATFPKNNCNSQANLASLAATGSQAHVCIVNRRTGSVVQDTLMNIQAGVGGGFFG